MLNITDLNIYLYQKTHLEMWTYHQRPKHVIKRVFSDVDTCFFTNVVCLNTYDIYGVKVVYNAQFFTRIPNP